MRLSPALLVALVLSCATTGPSEHREPPDDGSPVVTPREVPWKDMTGAQQGRYMRRVVTPKMDELFRANDPEAKEKVGCSTCHGDNAKARKFEMPSPDLLALPDSPDVFMATVVKKHPDEVKFMSEKVKPLMAELLGLKPFDPASPDPTAFGCGGCHPIEHVKQ